MIHKKINILAHAPFIGDGGYSNHSQDFLTRLNKYHNVKIRNFTIGKTWKKYSNNEHDKESYITNEHKNMLIYQTLFELDGSRRDYPLYDNTQTFIPDINIVLSEVDHYYFYDNYNGYKIAYTVWESTLYPSHFFDRLLKYDELWVPTTWQRDCSINQGYPPNKIKVVHEGVDVNIFNEFTNNSFVDKNRFKFGIFGTWQYRKSTAEIIKTFLKTFDKNEPIDLILSVDNRMDTDKLHTTENRLNHYGLTDNRIKILHFQNREDYINTLKSLNCFLSCARSEGWNLPLIEAMSCGIPSMYSNWGGQLEFSLNKGIPIDIVGEKPAIVMPGNYCEPDFEDLSKKMRLVYDNYKEYKNKAILDCKIIQKNFNWDYIVKNASDNINNIKI